MEKSEILSKIKNAITKVVEHQNFEVTETTTAQDVDGWESITHMMIISEVESVFNIKFKLMDLMNMNNVGDLLAIVQSEIN